MELEEATLREPIPTLPRRGSRTEAEQRAESPRKCAQERKPCEGRVLEAVRKK